MKPRVLIVDDQEDIRKLVHMTLDIGDVEVFEADSGESALEMMHRVKPGIVLMDIMMPGEIDGLEACRRIKADPQLKNLPVVMFTSSREEPDLAECYLVGVNAYVVKPVDFLQFTAAVKQVGIFWTLFNELPPPESPPTH